MDQKLLNRIAWSEIDRQGTEVFVDLSFQLIKDHQKRQEELVSEETIRCIHNAAFFECLKKNNPTGPRKERMAYLRFADTLKPKFFEIAEAMQNFQPTKST